MKKGQGYLAIIGVIVTILILCYQAAVGFGDGGSSAMNIKQGLDLAGGVSITYEVVGDEEPSAEDMSDTKRKLEQRVQQYSTEAIVYQEGVDRFSIEIPGVSDATEILADLGRPGSLYFISETSPSGEVNYAYQLVGDKYEVALSRPLEDIQEDGSIVLYGTDVKDAQAGSYSTQKGSEVLVSLTLTPEGTTKFAQATAKAAGVETIGIYYDGTFVSVPNVNEAITTGEAQISGMADFAEAEALASTIRIGGLSLELQEIYNKVVGAQLGDAALNTSIKAGMIGLAIVFIFMVVVYFLPGFAAGLALLMYVPFIVVLIHGFDMTLTLPGVAGIILSIGMAVDANVIIFARIREELATGKTVKSSIKIGFNKAFSAIIDGNVTTLIAAMVLMIMGSGVIKGFAQTLMLGIVLSMFTSLVITRLIVNAFYTIGFKNEKFYGIGKEIKTINFLGKKKLFFGISTALILAGVVMLGINAANTGDMLNYGLEFKGGTATTVVFQENMSLSDVNSEVVPFVEELISSSGVQPQVIEGSKEVVLKTRTLTADEREILESALIKKYELDSDLITSETISSTISAETRTETIIAVIVAVACMLVYIRFRFSDMRFGLSSVAALLHDVLVVLAFYAIAQITVGSTFIACMLTIVGYSINATIVIFDRIRENIVLAGKKYDLTELVNRSIGQTISRSLFTSFTTLVMVVVLFIMGVTSIKEFALPLIVGIICGTYSSVCLTGTMLYVLKTKIQPKKAA